MFSQIARRGIEGSKQIAAFDMTQIRQQFIHAAYGRIGGGMHPDVQAALRTIAETKITRENLADLIGTVGERMLDFHDELSQKIHTLVPTEKTHGFTAGVIAFGLRRLSAFPYNPEKPGALYDQADPMYLETMRTGITNSFHSLSAEEKNLVLSIVDDEAVQVFKLQAPSTLAKKVPVEQCLTKDEWLALYDYVDKSTGTFNLLRYTADMSELGCHTPAEYVAGFTNALDRAVQKLLNNPAFRSEENAVLYKGIIVESGASSNGNVSTLVGRDEVVNKGLHEAHESRGDLIIRRFIGATLDRNQSYLDRLGYGAEMQFTGVQAAKTELLCARELRVQQIVIIPRGKAFTVRSIGSRSYLRDTGYGFRTEDDATVFHLEKCATSPVALEPLGSS